MSQTVITVRFKVAGILTDATSAILQDETSTFGVKRLDTDATVVASGTNLTRIGTGVYSHTFTDPADGLSYEYATAFVFAGETHRFTGTENGGTDANQNLYDLIPEVRTNLSGQPTENAMKQMLRRISMDFCQKTEVWSEDLTPIPTVQLQQAYTLSTSFDANIHRVNRVDMDTQNMVLGTDGKDYRPVLTHTAASANKPITGADYTDFWELIGTEGVGDTWAEDTVYNNAREVSSKNWPLRSVDTDALRLVLDRAPSESNWNLDVNAVLIPKETLTQFPSWVLDRWGHAIADGAIGRFMQQNERDWTDRQGAVDYLNEENGHYAKAIIDARFEEQQERGPANQRIIIPFFA